MASVNLNYSAVDNSLTSLDSAIASIDDTIEYLQRNSVPWDFYRRTTLLNIIAALKKDKETLTYVRNWLINSNKNYDSLIDKLDKQAYKLPAYQIKRRNNIIS